jgi:hypothetical protein
MTYPNLAGVITKDDVFRKGTGSYAADYVSWARIANYLHTHASGWMMQVKQAPDYQGHVWKSPDGTGYLTVFFKHEDGTVTPDFIYAITDNRNNPISWDKINSRMVCDSHRRALCAASAFFFSLGYELWAREEVEAAKEDRSSTTVEQPAPIKQKAVAAATTNEQAPAEDPEELPITDKDLKAIRDLLTAEPVVKRNKIIKEFNKEFKVPEGDLMTAHITLPKHLRFIQERLSP